MEVVGGRGNGSSATFPAFVLLDGVAPVFRTRKTDSSVGAASSNDLWSPASPLVNGKSGGFEHCVSKMDTLAGIAIKYGVEVEDIKRVNGLVTDLHMFAHEKLQIPLPGRHPPSPILLNGSFNNGEQTPRSRHRRRDVLQSLQTLKLNPSFETASPAMSILHESNDWGSPKMGAATEGIELAILRTSRKLDFKDEFLQRTVPIPELPSQKFTKLLDEISLGGDFSTEDSQVSESKNNAEGNEPSAENSVRRRQKTGTASIVILSKSREPVKDPALRLKSGSSTDLDLLTNPIIILDSFMADGFIAARKSTSTSNLKESDSSIRLPTKKRTIKHDTPAWPMFDVLSTSSSSRRNKAA